MCVLPMVPGLALRLLPVWATDMIWGKFVFNPFLVAPMTLVGIFPQPIHLLDLILWRNIKYQSEFN